MGVALLAVATTAPAQELGWSGSLGYASGSYIFAEQFRTFSLLNTLSLRAGRLELSASLPVLAQNGTAVSYIAGVPIPTGGPDAGAVERRQGGTTVPVRPGRRGQGNWATGSILLATVADSLADSLTVAGTGSYEVNVADPMFGASLTAYEGFGAVRSLGFDAYAKAPIASVESGVGSGEWDYGAGASLALGSGETLLFANATYWILGDMPDLELEDALFYSLAVGHSLNDNWSLLASASSSTRIIAGSDPPASVNLSFSRRLTEGASINFGAGAGITETASAFSATIGWTTRLLGGPR